MESLLLTKIGTKNSVFKDAYYIRLKVFSEEQGIPKENELDVYDSTAYHSVVYFDNIPIVCGRLNIINDGSKICRIAVINNFRRNGYATKLCKHFISLSQSKGAKYVYLHAQTYTVDLYKKIGFVPEGNIFFEEQIPHIRMTKKL